MHVHAPPLWPPLIPQPVKKDDKSPKARIGPVDRGVSGVQIQALAQRREHPGGDEPPEGHIDIVA